jgi:hypothetical protein
MITPQELTQEDKEWLDADLGEEVWDDLHALDLALNAMLEDPK